MAWVMDVAWRAGVAIAVSASVTIAWIIATRLLARWNKPLRGDVTAGAIRPWPPLWWFMSLFMAGLTAIPIALIATQPWLLLAMPLFGVMLWQSILTWLPSAEVRWDAHSIEGPASQFSFGRKSMSWGVVEKTGTTLFSYYYLEDHRGDRVYWSYCYVAHLWAWDALLQRRPDLRDSIAKTLGTPVG